MFFFHFYKKKHKNVFYIYAPNLHRVSAPILLWERNPLILFAYPNCYRIILVQTVLFQPVMIGLGLDLATQGRISSFVYSGLVDTKCISVYTLFTTQGKSRNISL